MDVALSYLMSAFQIEAASLITQNGDDLYSFQKDDSKKQTESKPDSPPMVSYFLSNLAVKAAVDMLANGAKQGSEETEGLLQHSHGKPLAWVNEIFPLTVEFLTETGKAGGPKIKYTTAIWVDPSVELKPSFEDAIETFYDPDFYSQEFMNTKAVQRKVNRWIKRKTGGLIEDIFGSTVIGADTRLILATALKFEGEWFEPFEDAGVQPFEHLSGKKVYMPFMTSTRKHYVKQFPNYKLLSVPFKQHEASRFSMLFYLPDNIKDTEELRLFIGLHESVIQDVYFPEEQVQVGNFLIPKFKLNAIGPLPLKRQDDKPFEFEEMVNSSRGMISTGARLSSFLEINEKGIRAAGATAFFVDKKPRLAKRSIAQFAYKEKIEFVANRPFIFFIRDNQFGRMLFSGALVNPVGQLPCFKTIGE